MVAPYHFCLSYMQPFCPPHPPPLPHLLSHLPSSCIHYTISYSPHCFHFLSLHCLSILFLPLSPSLPHYKTLSLSLQNRKSYVHMGTTSGLLPKRDEHHLFVKFSALALPVNEPCELFFFIYDGRQSKVLRSV